MPADHWQLVSGDCLLSYDHPECRISGDHDSVGDAELGNSNCEEFGHDQFCFQEQVVRGEGFEAYYSPPLWKNDTYESSPLLPSDHKYSNLSPRTRLQAISEGRKELMEMIYNMPESSYELSLKDIVDHEQQRVEEEGNGEIDPDDDRSFCFENTAHIKKPKKKKNKNKNKNKKMIKAGGQISRSASMDSEIFLIKMFLPKCLGLERSTTNRNCSSKISPITLFGISEQHGHHKEQRIERAFVAGAEDRGSGKNCGSRVANNFSPGCWSFFNPLKSKANKQRGCISFE